MGVCPWRRLRRWGRSHACRWADRRRAADLQIHSRAERPCGGRQEGWGRARGPAHKGLKTGRGVQSEVSPRLPTCQAGSELVVLNSRLPGGSPLPTPLWQPAAPSSPSPHLRRARNTRALHAARVPVSWAGPPGCGVHQVSRGDSAEHKGGGPGVGLDAGAWAEGRLRPRRPSQRRDSPGGASSQGLPLQAGAEPDMGASPRGWGPNLTPSTSPDLRNLSEPSGAQECPRGGQTGNLRL